MAPLQKGEHIFIATLFFRKIFSFFLLSLKMFLDPLICSAPLEILSDRSLTLDFNVKSKDFKRKILKMLNGQNRDIETRSQINQNTYTRFINHPINNGHVKSTQGR